MLNALTKTKYQTQRTGSLLNQENDKTYEPLVFYISCKNKLRLKDLLNCPFVNVPLYSKGKGFIILHYVKHFLLLKSKIEKSEIHCIQAIFKYMKMKVGFL